MAIESVNDWVVKLRFDDSQIIKGQKKLDKMVDKVNRALSKGNMAALGATKAQQRTEMLGESAKMAAMTKREAQQRKMFKTEVEAYKEKEKRERRAEVQRRRMFKEEVAAYKENEKRSKKMTSPDRSQIQLSAAQRLRLENRVDTIVRRARQRGLEKDNPQAFSSIQSTAGGIKSSIGAVGSHLDLERVNNQITRLRENANQTKRSVGGIRGAAEKATVALNRLVHVYIALKAAMAGVSGVGRTITTFDSLRASLLAASGSTEQVAKDMQFIKRTAFDLGIQLDKVADGWKQIGIAGKAGNYAIEDTKEIFLAATEASRAYGLSADRAHLVYLAFTQMIGGEYLPSHFIPEGMSKTYLIAGNSCQAYSRH